MASSVFLWTSIGFFMLLCTSAGATLREPEPIEKSWWLSDNEIVYRRDKRMSIYNTLTGNVTIVPETPTNSSDETQISYSNDLRYTVQLNRIPDSRRQPDRKAYTVHIYDKITKAGYFVAGGEEILAFNEAHGKGVYSFVRDDNVYYLPNPEKPAQRVTNGRKNGMIHGRFDWVYNEEIFGRDQIENGAMWFSPSDKYLAYASRHVNSSNEMLMTTYERGNVYDYNYNMEYPKTGEKRLAAMTLSIWSVESNESITMDVHLRDNSSFHYLFGVSWVTLHGKELLVTTWANRWQNETALSLCDYEKAACSVIYEHKYDHGQWASPDDYAKIVHSNNSIFVILPKSIGDNAWQHIARLEITTDNKLASFSFVPSGEYDIKRIVGYRAEEDVIIYQAQAPHPWNQHVYGAPVKERSVLKKDRCLTCVYSNCTYQESSKISSSKKLQITLECTGPSNRHIAVFTYNATLHPSKIETVPGFSQEVAPAWEIETFLLSNGYEAIVKIYHGDTNLTSVPVTLMVYGGPDHNEATDMCELHPAPTGYDHAIVRIDARGSGGRGWKYRSAVYGRLVTVEVEDTVEAMEMVLAKYPRLDKSRVGVWGWSYGGTMTTALVESAPDGFFKCAYVGAPVTNFIYYDATYTERYMGDAPPSSYTDLNLNVTKFEHTKLMLVHGMRDDNVHFQNSALLIEALQQADIPFELMVYPNQPHGIRMNHFYHLDNTFFSECFA